MVSTGVIIAVGALLIGGVNVYYVLKLYRRMQTVTEEVGSHFSEIDVDNKISELFSGTSSKTVDGISKLVFSQLKSKFNMRARSYNELIEEIKMHEKINLELKQTLIDFFQDIIRISYRAEELQEDEREDLKKKIKSILQQLH